jgi:hypothetical protein
MLATSLAYQKERRKSMLRFTLALGATSLLALTSVALAQDAPPTYKADPDVYKLIFEDQNFRVIDTVRKKGVHDKLHSHPVPFVIYYVTDCKDQLYGPDGKPVGLPSEAKAGTARSFPVVHAHSAENVGNGDCHTIFVEHK